MTLGKHMLSLTKFCCLSCELNVKTGIQINTTRPLRFCAHCMEQKLKGFEDKCHLTSIYVSMYVLYTNIQKKYFPFASNCSYSVFLQLMSTDRGYLTQTLAYYASLFYNEIYKLTKMLVYYT